MKITVKVKILSKEEKIVRSGPKQWIVYVKAPPSDGKANNQVIKLIAEYLKIPKSAVKIISGIKSRNKIIEIVL
ncbi:MAG: DUF167 domain-containing protein [Candidatus Ratteibacteria bacterium]